MNKLEAKLVKQLLGKSKFGVEDIVVVAALMDMVEIALEEPKINEGPKSKNRDKTTEWELQLDDDWIYEGVDIENRKIYFDDSVREERVGFICRALILMNSRDSEAPIHFYINSGGGSCYQGFSLYDTLRALDCEVITYATGHVMSMGTVLFLAGDTRITYPSTAFMNHTITSWFEGKHFENKVEIVECERIWQTICAIYQDRADPDAEDFLTAKQWAKRLECKDYFYDSDGAIAHGFAHSILKEGGLT